MGCWVSCVEFDTRIGKVRQHSEEVEEHMAEVQSSLRSIKKHMRERNESHILEMRELKSILGNLNEALRKSEGVRKADAIRARELVRDCIAAIAKREALDAQENTLMYETAIRLEEASRQEDIKRFSENLKAVSNTLIESQAKRKQILDEIEADTSTAPYHPGTWTTYFNKKDQRFYHWWTCCQQIGAGCESSPGCHNRRPRDLTLGKLEGGSLPRLEFE